MHHLSTVKNQWPCLHCSQPALPGPIAHCQTPAPAAHVHQTPSQVE